MDIDSTLPEAFRFEVKFAGSGLQIENATFQEVSGFEASIDLDSVVEGGENRFVHQLPRPSKHGSLVLKRGITGSRSALATWCKDMLEGSLSKEIVTKDLIVTLLDEDKNPLISWAVDDAYPIKLSVDELSATNNLIKVETIEFSYSAWRRTTW